MDDKGAQTIWNTDINSHVLVQQILVQLVTVALCLSTTTQQL